MWLTYLSPRVIYTKEQFTARKLCLCSSSSFFTWNTSCVSHRRIAPGEISSSSSPVVVNISAHFPPSASEDKSPGAIRHEFCLGWLPLLLLLLLYCGLTKQKGMCARTRIHIRQTGTHCMREKTTKNEGMGYKFFCFKKTPEKKWNPANCRFRKKNSTLRYPSNRLVEVRPPLTHWLIVPVYGPTFFLFFFSFFFILWKNQMRMHPYTQSLTFFCLFFILSAWLLQRP